MARDETLNKADKAEEKLRLLLSKRSKNDLKSTSEGEPISSQDEALLDDGSFLELVEPDGSGSWLMRVIPSSIEPAQLPRDEASLGHSLIDGVARAMPQVASAIKQGRVFELIAPTPALEALKNGTMELIPAKSGGFIGGIRIVGKKEIVHQARFREVKLSNTIGPGVAMVAASAVLGHMHMVEIRQELAAIGKMVSLVLQGQQAVRHGKLLGSAEVLYDIGRTGFTGTMSSLNLQRLTGVELEIRQVMAELESLHQIYATNTATLQGAGLKDFVTSFADARQREINDAQLYLLALAAHMEVERLYLAYATESDSDMITVRERALEAATSRLESAEEVFTHLRNFQSFCREALNKDQARPIRLSTEINEQVSEALYQDQKTVSDLFATARRFSAISWRENTVNIIRVDSRSGRVHAQASLLNASEG